MIIKTERMVFCPVSKKTILFDNCERCKYHGGFVAGTLDIYCNIPMEQ